MKTVLRVTLIVLIGFAVGRRPAHACTCAPLPAPLVALDQADFVFAGKVIRITTGQGEYGQMLHVLFEVDAYRKGAYGAQVLIETAVHSASCGFPFERGRKYLVYGFRSDASLTTNICTRTSRLEDAGEDLAALGDAEEVAVSRSRCGGPTNAAAIQAVLFCLLAGLWKCRVPKDE